MKTIRSTALAVVGFLFLTAGAEAVCVQNDITGTWHVFFSTTRCVLRISSDGSILPTPESCQYWDTTTGILIRDVHGGRWTVKPESRAETGCLVAGYFHRGDNVATHRAVIFYRAVLNRSKDVIAGLMRNDQDDNGGFDNAFTFTAVRKP